MKYVAAYLLSTTKLLFSTVLGWTLNVITVIALAISVTFQSVPLYIWISTAVVNILIAMYLAWKNERVALDNMRNELQQIKDTIPQYSFNVSRVEKFSIDDSIDSVMNEIDELKTSIEAKKERSRPAHGDGSKISMMMRALGSLGDTPGILGGRESDSEKLQRLTDFLRNLKRYREYLKYLYKVEMTIRTTRHDNNIEIRMESEDIEDIIIEDSYERDGLPHSSPPRDDVTRNWIAPVDFESAREEKYYLRTSYDQGCAMSELAFLNASRDTRPFRDSIYLICKSSRATLTASVHSSLLRESQDINISIPLDNAVVTPIVRK